MKSCLKVLGPAVLGAALLILSFAATALAIQTAEFDASGKWRITVTSSGDANLDGTYDFEVYQTGFFIWAKDLNSPERSWSVDVGSLLPIYTFRTVGESLPFYVIEITVALQSDTSGTGEGIIAYLSGSKVTPMVTAQRTGYVQDDSDLYHQFYIPHITGNDANWQDRLLCYNNSNDDQPARYAVVLYDASGAVVSNQLFELAKGKYAVHDLKGFANSAQSGIVIADKRGMNFIMGYIDSLEGLANFTLSQGGSANLAFNFPNAYSAYTVWKGLALCNSGELSAAVTLYAIGNGAVLETKVVTLEPHTKLLGSVDTLFNTARTADVEQIVAVSDGGLLSGLNVSGNADNSRVMFSLAQPAESYLP